VWNQNQFDAYVEAVGGTTIADFEGAYVLVRTAHAWNDIERIVSAQEAMAEMREAQPSA